MVRKGIKILQITPDDENNNQLSQQYDCICTNQKGQSKMFKLHNYHDLIKIQNFYDGLQELNEINDILKFIDVDQSKIVISYIPDSKEQILKKQQGFQLHQTYEFDQYKQNNEFDFQNLEQQYENLKYESIETDCLFGIIRNEQLAQKIGLSQSEIGNIYVLKRTDEYQANESSIVINDKEYYMCKIEPDPNLEGQGYFWKKDRQELNILKEYVLEKFIQPTEEQREIQTKNYDVDKLLQRIGLRTQPYVTNILNEQQLLDSLLVAKQMGVQYYLLYIINDSHKKQDIIKKLVNLKKTLNVHQQQKLTIYLSDNIDLFQKYFQVIGDGFNDQIRLIKIDQKQNIQIVNFTQYIKVSKPKPNISLNDRLEEIQTQSYFAERYRFFGKPSYNRLKYFIQQTIPELDISNTQKPNEIDHLLYEQYQETTQQINRIPSQIKVVTARDFQKSIYLNKQQTIVYFYKSNCIQCQIMNQTFENASKILTDISNEVNKLDQENRQLPLYEDNIINRYRIQHPQKFKNLAFKKYNILNEINNFPSPSAAPLIFLFKGAQQPIYADLVKNRILASDEKKFISYLIKFIDNS